MTSSFRRDNMSSGTLLVSQCCKIKRKSRYQGTRFVLRIKIIHLCGLFAKHSQKFYCIADDPASLAFEAIETIIWKLPIAPVVRIVSKYFETTGAIGTIRAIIWKPGFRFLEVIKSRNSESDVGDTEISFVLDKGFGFIFIFTPSGAVQISYWLTQTRQSCCYFGKRQILPKMP